MPLRGLFLLAFFLGSLPVCFVRPFYGIALWIVVAFLNPQSALSYWSAANEFPWALVVAIPTLAGFAVFCRGWASRLRSAQVVMIVILWVWFTITTIVSTNTPLFIHHSGDTWYRWGFVSKILLMTLAMIAVVDSFQRFRVLLIVIASCFGFYVAKALPFMILTGGAYRLYGPQNSMVADNNDLGLALNMTLPLFLFLAQTESNPWVKRLFWFFFLIAIPAVFCTYSRGALLGLIAILLLMFIQLRQRLLLIPVMVFGAILVMLFAPAEWKQRMDPTRSDAVDASAQERIHAWAFAWNLASDYPITGGGFDTFTRELFSRYAPDSRDVHGPHSIYFGVLGDHGFVGLFLYLLLIAVSLAGARRLVKQARRYGDMVTASYANMSIFSLVGFLTSGAFLGRAYFDYFFAIVACIAILRHLCKVAWAQDKSPADEEAEEFSLPAEAAENFA